MSNIKHRSSTDNTKALGDGFYHCVKGNAIQLVKNFQSTEFDCHGNGCCSTTVINEKLVQYLQQIREHFQKTVTITSAYRCPVHNKNVNGATGSRHVKGDAADIVVNGVTPAEVAKYAESIGIKGIGLYDTTKDGHFVHIDTRTTKSFWFGHAQEKRSTFGGTPIEEGEAVEQPVCDDVAVDETTGNTTTVSENKATAVDPLQGVIAIVIEFLSELFKKLGFRN